MTALASYAAIGVLLAGAAVADTWSDGLSLDGDTKTTATHLVAGSGDYALVAPIDGTNELRICAKSSADCEKAREAIRKGWWPILGKDVTTVCRPAPGCFSTQSNCIVGFSC